MTKPLGHRVHTSTGFEPPAALMEVCKRAAEAVARDIGTSSYVWDAITARLSTVIAEHVGPLVEQLRRENERLREAATDAARYLRQLPRDGKRTSEAWQFALELETAALQPQPTKEVNDDRDYSNNA